MSAHVLVGSFFTCVLSGFVPLVNGEVVVVGAALLLPAAERVPLVLLCASGQMLAKLILYALARWSPARLPPPARRALWRVEKLRAMRGGSSLLLLTSAVIGVPPFYLVTLAAGLVGVRPARFAVLGFAGTVVRYAVLTWSASRLAAASGVALP
jgi:membrane protein YqaA with SNARE-associated domain